MDERKKPTAPARRKTGAARRPAGKTPPPPRRKTAKPRPVPRKKPAQPSSEPEVVYTPPAPFSRGRLLLRLISVVAVVLAVIFGMSIFFKVGENKILVSGNHKYSIAEIQEASGIRAGDSLMTFGETKAAGRIKAKLPYVKNVRIGIKLPDTVIIMIEEMDAVYAVRDTYNSWWLISADGIVVEQTDLATAGEHTKLLGVALNQPQKGQQAVAAETTGSEEDTPVTVQGAQRLQVALSIAQYLEDNGVVGKIVSMDVSNLGDIQLWYGQQYQVLLGDTTRLSEKVFALRQCVDKLASFESGVLDLTFATMDKPMYTPFDKGGE